MVNNVITEDGLTPTTTILIVVICIVVFVGICLFVSIYVARRNKEASEHKKRQEADLIEDVAQPNLTSVDLLNNEQAQRQSSSNDL